VGKAELINMGKDEQDVAKTSGLAMSLDSEAAEQSADDSDENDVEARLLATRKEFEEEREKKTEEKKDLYLQVSFMLFELPCLSLVDVRAMIECCLVSVALAAMLYLLSQYCFIYFKQVAVLQQYLASILLHCADLTRLTVPPTSRWMVIFSARQRTTTCHGFKPTWKHRCVLVRVYLSVFVCNHSINLGALR